MHFERFARLNNADPALRQHAPMEEGVAGPIGEFDEPKPLFRAEPFDHPMEWRAGRCLEPGLAAPGSGAENTRLWVVGIRVEVATPRTVKILISQIWFLAGWCQIRPGSATSDAPRVTDEICLAIVIRTDRRTTLLMSTAVKWHSTMPGSR